MKPLVDAGDVSRFKRVELGNFPTPVEFLPSLSSATNCEIHVKRDDLASDVYGGNKVRKLELLLAQAQARDAKRILTSGGVGSNYIVAVASHARKVNMLCEAIMIDQPLTPNVRKNLLLAHHFGATIHYAYGFAGGLIKLVNLYGRFAMRDRKIPYTVRPGGATPEGSLGYALAAMELAEQIENGDCSRPDALFVTIGSCGTLAGLVAGMSLTDLGIPIIGVRVVETYIVNRPHINWLATQVLRRILEKTNRGQKLPRLANYEIQHGFFGGCYGQPTLAGNEAMRLAKEKDGLVLDPVYTGKTFAALLDWCNKPENYGKRALFWHTYSSRDYSEILQELDWRCLPRTVWKYFDGSIPMAAEK